jgi:3-phytase
MRHHGLSVFVLSLAPALTTACTQEPDESTDAPAFLVAARGETSPSQGDPDDSAIWQHPSDPGQSLIVTTNKTVGLQVYALDGTLHQEVRDGGMNNVDLRMGVELDGMWGAEAAMIATSNRSLDTIDLYTIDPSSRMLVRLGETPTDIGEPYGLCMFRSPHDGRVYVIIDDRLGAVAQYEVAPDPQGVPALTLRRTLQFDGGLEGCVADDELARLYIGQEELGVWRIDAEPDSDDEPILLHDVDAPYLAADVEGMTIYYAANGKGYLLVSSQGSNSYAVFERGGDNAYLTSFRIGVGGLDAAVETDGIDITNVPLGPLWPDGLLVAHDDHNEGFSRNFKLVGWGDVVAAADIELLIDTEHRVGQ